MTNYTDLVLFVCKISAIAGFTCNPHLEPDNFSPSSARARFLEQHRFITDHQGLEKGTKSGHDGLQPSPFDEPQIVYQAHPLELLRTARQRYTQKQLAEILEVNIRTVRRETDPPAGLTEVIRHRILPLAEDSGENDKLRFIDLFAGTGGIRMGFKAHGGKCVFSSEWNRFSRKTCLANFPQTPDHVFVGDITKVDEQDIPDHEILLAGFPCQPFSITGVSKKMPWEGHTGSNARLRALFFFDVARIIAEKQPEAFLLENVKNLPMTRAIHSR